MALVATCKNCYGKGFSTEFKGAIIGEPDFEGDKRILIAPEQIVIHYCKCKLGKSMERFANKRALDVLNAGAKLHYVK